MPPSSQLRRRHHRHTGDRGLHAHVQPPHGSSVRMEEGRAFLQAPEGQACCSSATAISRLRNTGNYDPDEVLVNLSQLIVRVRSLALVNEQPPYGAFEPCGTRASADAFGPPY